MLAANVEAWALTLVPIAVVAFLGVLGWVLKQVVTLGQLIAAIQTEVRSNVERLDRLEAWQDGFRIGQVAANGHDS